jgi:hypothetical protein
MDGKIIKKRKRDSDSDYKDSQSEESDEQPDVVFDIKQLNKTFKLLGRTEELAIEEIQKNEGGAIPDVAEFLKMYIHFFTVQRSIHYNFLKKVRNPKSSEYCNWKVKVYDPSLSIVNFKINKLSEFLENVK